MEIHYSKLNNYLIGKKILPENWSLLLKEIESNINKIFSNKINCLDRDTYKYLLSVKEDKKDYFFVNKLFKFLISSNEGKKKTFFGYYKSPLIVDLIEIKNLYEKNHLYLSEIIKETNYLINFGLSYIDKEQKDIISKIKNTKRKISEIESTQLNNKKLIEDYLLNFKMTKVINEFKLNKTFFSRNELSFEIEEYFNNELLTFSEKLNNNIKKLLENNSLINLYKELIKEANCDLTENDNKLDLMVKFSTLEKVNNIRNIEINDNNFSIEIIEEFLEIQDNYNEFTNTRKNIQELPPQLFENRKLLGDLLIELFEIKSFLKRVLIENYGIEWPKMFNKKNSRDSSLVNFFYLVEEIIKQLTDIKNYEIIIYRRDKYALIEKYVEKIFSLFSNFNTQENNKNELKIKIKKYYEELNNLEKNTEESNEKINKNIKTLETKLNDIFKNKFIIKISKF